MAEVVHHMAWDYESTSLPLCIISSSTPLSALFIYTAGRASVFRDRPSLRGDIIFWFGVTREEPQKLGFATHSTAYVRYSSAFDYTPIFRAFLIDIAFQLLT